MEGCPASEALRPAFRRSVRGRWSLVCGSGSSEDCYFASSSTEIALTIANSVDGSKFSAILSNGFGLMPRKTSKSPHKDLPRRRLPRRHDTTQPADHDLPDFPHSLQPLPP